MKEDKMREYIIKQFDGDTDKADDFWSFLWDHYSDTNLIEDLSGLSSKGFYDLINAEIYMYNKVMKNYKN